MPLLNTISEHYVYKSLVRTAKYLAELKYKNNSTMEINIHTILHFLNTVLDLQNKIKT